MHRGCGTRRGGRQHKLLENAVNIPEENDSTGSSVLALCLRGRHHREICSPHLTRSGTGQEERPSCDVFRVSPDLSKEYLSNYFNMVEQWVGMRRCPRSPFSLGMFMCAKPVVRII